MVSVENALLFAGILVASLAVAKAVYWVVQHAVRALSSRTATTLDDKLVSSLETPLYFAVALLGAYLGSNWLLVGTDLYSWVSSSITVFVLLLGAFSLSRIADALLDWYAEDVAPKRGVIAADIVALIKRIIKGVLFIISVVFVLGFVGVEVTPLLASLGIAGLAVALALQDTLANFFAGVYITADRPVRVGDFVEIEGTNISGYVARIGWRTTRLRMLSNNIVVIPNQKLGQSIVTNYYLPEREMAVVQQVSVNIDSDLDNVEKICVEVASDVQSSVPGAVQGFVPFIRYHTFSDSGVTFSVILRVKEYTDQYLVVHEFVKRIHKRFRKEGIQFASPKRSVKLEDQKQLPSRGRKRA